jgi:hypothetical protein
MFQIDEYMEQSIMKLYFTCTVYIKYIVLFCSIFIRITYSCNNMIFSLDDLLRAGILLAENVVVVNKELSNSAEEETLADCNTIVAVQTMFK